MADTDLDHTYEIVRRDAVPAPALQPDDSLQKRIADLRKWLQPTDYLSAGNEFMKHLHSYAPGTGEWVQSSSVFRSWARANSGPSNLNSCLHARGVAGSGKSVFAANTIRQLQESGAIVLFFFFRQIVDKNHTAKYLVRDFAAQLLSHCPAFATGLSTLSQEHPVNECEIDLVWPAITKALEEDLVPGKVYCVVDALDEMDDGDFDGMVERLVALGTAKPEKIRVMMTSRPLPKIEQALRSPSVAQLRLDPAHLFPDVARYVDARMATLDPPLGDDKNELVKNTICERASGLFLHARLVADNLAEGLRDGRITEKTLPDSLDRVPHTLREVYEDMLRTHAHRSGVTAEQQAKILMCVTHASRPLRLIELASLLSRMLKLDLRRGKDLVRAGCGRLLEILEDETVSVIHHSFTEFLHDAARKADSASFPVLDAATSHSMLVVLSLEYLDGCPQLDTAVNDAIDLDDDIYLIGQAERDRQNGIRTQIRLSHPLASYAVDNLSFHLENAASAGPVGQVLEALDRYFVSGKPALDTWVLFSRHARLFASFNIFHLATTVRFSKPLPLYVLGHYGEKLPALLDVPDPNGRTPLSYAAQNGYADIAKFLLDKGADQTSVSKNGLTPLHWAVKEGKPEAVRVLLDAGVDPLIMTGPVLRVWNSYESEYDEYTEEQAEERRETALDCAFQRRNAEVIKAFMPFVTPDKISWCFHQIDDVANVEAILEMGKIDIDAFHCGMTKLYRAAQSRKLDMIKLLLKHGADPNSRCSRFRYQKEDEVAQADRKRGPTPLHCLSGFHGEKVLFAKERENTIECVRVLVDAGANINATMDTNIYCKDMTPLHFAVHNQSSGFGNNWGSYDKSEEILTEALLLAGANPNAKTQNGDTPAHIANPEKITLLDTLVEHGANIYARNERGRTPLLEMIDRLANNSPVFAKKSCDKVLDKLLALGPDMSIVDNMGDTVIHHIMQSIRHLSGPEYFPFIQNLVHAGARLNQRNTKGNHPLQRYIERRWSWDKPGDDDEDLLQILVKAGMEVDARDDQGQTVLWSIVERSGEGLGTLKKFLRLGADPQVRASDGTTLLDAVIKHERPVEWIRFLASVGVSAEVSTSQGDTLLHTLFRRSSHSRSDVQAMIQALVDLGVSPLAKNEKGQSVLHVAKTVQCLEAGLASSSFKGLDASEPDVDGFTPLHNAVTLGDRAVGVLLHSGADPTALTASNLSLLHLAAEKGEAGVVGLLLAQYRKLGVLEKHVNLIGGGRTPLHYACRSGTPASVWILLRNGADLSLRDENGLMPVHALAEDDLSDPRTLVTSTSVPTRTSDIIGMLQRAGADLNAEIVTSASEEKEAMTPLDVAVALKRWEMVRALLACGVEPRDSHKQSKDFILATDKHKAADEARMAQIKAPRGRQAGDRHRRWRGRWSSSLGPPEAGEEVHFISGGQAILDVDAEYSKVAIEKAVMLTSALRDGDFDSIKEYAQLGGDLLVQDPYNPGTLLDYLVKWGYDDLLEHFRDKLAELEDNFGSTSLLVTACSQSAPSLRTIQLLVEKLGISVDAIDNGKERSSRLLRTTALHILAKGAHFWQIEALEYMLFKGADIEARDWRGLTPLQAAIDKKYGECFWGKETARVLLQHGADPNATVLVEGKRGETFAGVSTLELWGNPEITKALVEHGACVENLPGLVACAVKATMEPRTVKLLLEAGLDPNEWVPAQEGDSPDAAEEEVEENQKQKAQDCEEFSDVEEEEEYDDDQYEFRRQPGNSPHYALHEAARPTTSDEVPTDYHLRQQAMVDLLLAHGADPWALYPDGSSVLQCIVEDRGLVDRFLPRLPQKDLDRRGRHGRTLLTSACVPTVPVGSEPAINASQEKNPATVMVDVVHALLELGADVLATDDEGRTPLHWFCTLPGHFDDSHCKAFIALANSSHAAMNMADNTGRKPIHLALAAYADCSQQSAFAIRHLMSVGTEMSEPDPMTSNSALHMIAPRLVGEASAADEASALLREVAASLDINVRNSSGETPVFSFAAAGWECIRGPEGRQSRHVTHATALGVFKDLGTDLMAVNNRGQTLLHVTVERKLPDTSYNGDQREDLEKTFEKLMELGVDPHREDEELRSSIDVAVARDLRGVVHLFSEEGRLQRARKRDDEQG